MACSVTCGGGVRVLERVCIAGSDIVDMSMCNGAGRREEFCNDVVRNLA